LLLLEGDALLLDFVSLARCVLQGLLRQQLPAAATEGLLLPGVPIEAAVAKCSLDLLQQEEQRMEKDRASTAVATYSARVAQLVQSLQGNATILRAPADRGRAAPKAPTAAVASNKTAVSICCCWSSANAEDAGAASMGSATSTCCSRQATSGCSGNSSSSCCRHFRPDTASKEHHRVSAPASSEAAAAAAAVIHGFKVLFQRLLTCVRPHVGALRQLRRCCREPAITVVCCTSNGKLVQQLLPLQLFLDRVTHTAGTGGSSSSPEAAEAVAAAAAASMLRPCHLLHMHSSNAADFAAAVSRIAAAAADDAFEMSTAAAEGLCGQSGRSCCGYCASEQLMPWQQQQQQQQITVVVAASTEPFARLAAAAGYTNFAPLTADAAAEQQAVSFQQPQRQPHELSQVKLLKSFECMDIPALRRMHGLLQQQHEAGNEEDEAPTMYGERVIPCRAAGLLESSSGSNNNAAAARAAAEAQYWRWLLRCGWGSCFFLQEPLVLQGRVVRGFGRGSSLLGIPTANLLLQQQEEAENAYGAAVDLPLVPGIYFGWAAVLDENEHPGVGEPPKPGGPWKAVLSFGFNPHFANQNVTIEPHLLTTGFGDLRGRALRLAICGFIRSEAAFASFSHLVTAIQSDCDLALLALSLLQATAAREALL
ncbi:uncharacterized protein LOC34621523, partial [Cyclospora cayetanensis]|uniref:riboflavin kinase n=1 Tax=Cyclospora cayetanensis TaxID=88456 RepID=A0A6P6S1D0_9EIME